jgi:hypothetical protein
MKRFSTTHVRFNDVFGARLIVKQYALPLNQLLECLGCNPVHYH